MVMGFFSAHSASAQVAIATNGRASLLVIVLYVLPSRDREGARASPGVYAVNRHRWRLERPMKRAALFHRFRQVTGSRLMQIAIEIAGRQQYELI